MHLNLIFNFSILYLFNLLNLITLINCLLYYNNSSINLQIIFYTIHIHLLPYICNLYSLCAYTPLPIFEFESHIFTIQLLWSMMCSYALL